MNQTDSMDKPLLSIQNLTVKFKTQEELVTAVNNVSFDIPKGKTVGLVGESGSGKSVTSLATMGLIPMPPGQITSGTILFHGEDLLQKSEKEMRKIRGNRISMIFQEPMTALNPVFRIGSQISEVLRLHKGMSKKQAWNYAIDLLDQVGIPDPKNKIKAYPHEMSGGQKQRVMIAMAIACEPDLLICDEPTTALDVTIQKQVLDLMLDLQEKYHMSMLFITHDLGVIADLADDVVVMYRSNIVEKNHSHNIFKNPQHPYTKGLIACRPLLEGNPQRLLTVSDYMDEDGSEKSIPAEKFKPMIKPDKNDIDKHPVLLEVKNLNTWFPVKGGLFKQTKRHVKAVNNVSFTVHQGETLGLVGESGCGKTTLGRTILRLQQATSGEVIYDGINVMQQDKESLRKLRSRMQIIFQDPYSSLNPRMTIGDILTEPMAIHGIGSNKKERFERAKELMQKVDLKPQHLNRYPHEFSGGQRQRICIARAIGIEPEFIICDESVSALDVSVQAQVLNLLQDLQQDLKLTYIFISHDLSVVNYISDRVGVMNNGEIVELDTAENIYKNPQRNYTKRLLDAIPKGTPKDLI
ncbi:MAG TPA: ABC transporter ATP-binding protein [Gammaproteobacteria bacterium]|nr:ABC transporter ATP-binding protein [Xanthomonadales bacterium]HPQ88112.1 ABC transporter ATP-binding protein [Gammaproteobacteria bacterium]